MIYDVLMVALRTLGGVVAAAALFFGFVFFIFLGEANARDRPLVSAGFDSFAAVVLYLSWFGPMWWFGFSPVLLMVACGAATILCLMYAASYQTATVRRLRPARPQNAGGA